MNYVRRIFVVVAIYTRTHNPTTNAEYDYHSVYDATLSVVLYYYYAYRDHPFFKRVIMSQQIKFTQLDYNHQRNVFE